MSGKTPYEVLARKYRPQQFADVVGQDHVTRTLANAIRSGRIAHAYLLVGPRGIGKTSIARIFSKALNCRKGTTAEPCGTCESCLEVAAGRSLDVLEIDGASNNGVDQVRELRDNAQYVPARGPYKVYVIDEVHMLTLSAFNALLKTLEEPPKHVKFVFATTEPQKVPATIASRCQRFDLRRISAGDITGHLRKIASLEQVTVDDEALFAIARGAEGGMRDAESAFDQLISFCGRTIVESDVLSVFGLVSRQTIESLASATLRGEITGILSGLAELDQSGKDLQRVVLDLLEHFRNVLVVQQGAAAAAGLDLLDSQVSTLKAHAARVDASQLLRIVELLIETESRLRTAVSRRTLLEACLIRCARAATTVSIESVLRQLAALKQSIGIVDTDPAPPPKPESAAPDPAPRPPARTPSPEPANPTPPPRTQPPTAPNGDLSAAWPDVLAEIHRVAPRLAASLKGSRVQRSEGGLRILADPSQKPETLSDPKMRRLLEQTIQRRFGAGTSVETIVAQPGESASGTESAPRPVEAERASPATTPAEPGAKPIVKRAPEIDATARDWLDSFNGSIQ